MFLHQKVQGILVMHQQLALLPVDLLLFSQLTGQVFHLLLVLALSLLQSQHALLPTLIPFIQTLYDSIQEYLGVLH